MTLERRLAHHRDALERELLTLGELSGGDDIDAAPAAELLALQLATGGKRLRGLLPDMRYFYRRWSKPAAATSTRR